MLNDITEKIDVWYADFEKEIVAKQDVFFKDHGRYWQGLSTHSEVPDQTSARDVVSDKLDVATTEGDKWSDFTDLLDSSPIPASITCDAYNGPEGAGYQISMVFKYEGLIYSKTVNYGPEKYRDKPWDIQKEPQKDEVGGL